MKQRLVTYLLVLLVGIANLNYAKINSVQAVRPMFRVPICAIPNICKVLPWCCGNFTDFPTILNEVLRKNASNLQNAPAFFIPFRVNSFSAAQYKQQFKPSYPAKNTISGNFQGDGRRSRNTESEESNGGRFSREYSFDGNSNYGGFVGNEVFGGNRFGTNIYESVGEVNRFGNSKNQGGYSNRGIYGGGLGRYN